MELMTSNEVVSFEEFKEADLKKSVRFGSSSYLIGRARGINQLFTKSSMLNSPY